MTDIDPAYAAGLAADGLARFVDSEGKVWLISRPHRGPGGVMPIREETLRTWRRTNIPTPDYTPRSVPITAPIKRRIRIVPGPSGVTIECHRCRRAFTRPSRRAAERFARVHIRLHPITDKEL